MGQSKWSYLQNPFDNVTKRSNKLLYLMATDHFDKLAKHSNQPKIKELYDFGKPYFDEFTIQYRKVSGDEEIYKKCTRDFVDLIDDLSGVQARRWDVQIQLIYDKPTKEYQYLMPYGRSVFQTGAYDLRINETKKLSDRLSEYPNLASLKQEVDAFYTNMIETRTIQQGIESVVQMNSSDMENTRYKLTQVMHSIFGALLHIYFLDTSLVDAYYELKYLRRSSSKKNNDVIETESAIIEPLQTIALLENKVELDNTVRLINTGQTDVLVYPAEKISDVSTKDNTYLVYGGQLITFKIKENQKMVLVKNDDSTMNGSIQIELLE